MTVFEEEGFLADDFDFFQKELEDACGEPLSICLDLSRHAQRFQYSLRIHSGNLPEVISAALFARVLSTFQASVLLAQRGMRFQVEMLIRCILEAVFPLVAVSKSPEFANTYVLAEEHERLKAIKRVARCKKRLGENSGLHVAGNLEAEVEKDIRDRKIRHLSTYDCADKAGMADYYDTLYCYTSMSLHASPRSLQEALDLDPAGVKVTALKNEPDSSRLGACLVTLGDCLAKSVSAMSLIFDVAEPPSITDLSARLDEHASRLI